MAWFIRAITSRTMTLASAGHLPPLVKSNGSAELATLRTGLPVGVAGPGAYEAVVVDIPPKGTVLLYTDGLVERRGESLDLGIARLSDALVRLRELDVDSLADRLLAELPPRSSLRDDIALIVLRI